jgi:hypothetical protein
MATAKRSTEARWWAKNIVVPLLGTGGLVALVTTFLQKPDPKPHENQPANVSVNQPVNSPTINGAQNVTLNYSVSEQKLNDLL